MKITSIHPLLPLIEQKPEFVLLDKGDYQVIDYVYMDKNTFEYPELMECRGIKFCRDGLILARPFRKFFNYGEQGSDLPLHRPHVITEKLDGSMIHPVLIDGRLYLHTRKGHTDVAKKAERFVMSSERKYGELCRAAIRSGYTPIFEYIGPENRIVLRYDEEDMQLLAMRHMILGTILDFGDVRAMGVTFNVPVVEIKNFQLKGQLEVFLTHARGLKDAEGYVVYYDDGYMVKIKADDYVLKHRALDDMSSKKKVVALCAQGFMDDVLGTLDDADRDELLEFNDEIQGEITKMVMAAQGLVAPVRSGTMTRKEYALAVAPKVKPKWLNAVVFGLLDSKDPRKAVIDSVIKYPDDLGLTWRGQ